MKIITIRDKSIYKLLMLLAERMDGGGYKGFKAESKEYEILVTIRVKENNK